VSYGSVDSVVEERDVLVLQYFLDLIWVRMGNTYASVGALSSMEQNNATIATYASVGALSSMEQNNATMATLTEHLSAVENTYDEIDGAAKITHRQIKGVWQTDDGERLEDDPDEYCVVCSCGEEFRICGNAIYHVEEEH